MWYQHHVEYLYIKEEDDVVVLIMMDKGFSKEIAISYVYKIKEEVLKRFEMSNIQKAPQYSLVSLKPVIREVM